MFIIYDLIFILFALFCLPFYIIKGKLRPSFLMRLGILPKDVLMLKNQAQGPIWIHAVSVGEAISVKPLLEELGRIFPLRRIVISTVTVSGNKIAQSFKAKEDLVIYLPFDISFITRNVVKRIRPGLFIAMETEIWPNMISALHNFNVPIVLVNGRISNGSFAGYKKIKIFTRPILEKINLFCMQTGNDSKRIIFLGAHEEKVKIVGNMKFDAIDYKGKAADYREEYKKVLGLTSTGKLIVAGSTHAGEEEIILHVYKKLIGDFPGLKLLIAPRNIDRSASIEKLINKFNFKSLRISQAKRSGSNTNSLSRVFVLDTIGELVNFYAISDLVFVGGSLVKKGGHNIIEPALFEKPIIFGLHMSNFRDIAEAFLSKAAALQVKDSRDLYNCFKELLINREKRESLGILAKAVTEESRGATKKVVSFINEKIPI